MYNAAANINMQEEAKTNAVAIVFILVAIPERILTCSEPPDPEDINDIIFKAPISNVNTDIIDIIALDNSFHFIVDKILIGIVKAISINIILYNTLILFFKDFKLSSKLFSILVSKNNAPIRPYKAVNTNINPESDLYIPSQLVVDSILRAITIGINDIANIAIDLADLSISPLIFFKFCNINAIEPKITIEPAKYPRDSQISLDGKLEQIIAKYPNDIASKERAAHNPAR